MKNKTIPTKTAHLENPDNLRSKMKAALQNKDEIKKEMNMQGSFHSRWGMKK
ncbi:hypothetical protein [Chitiniphilus eburneus]|uniref:hypothetical protein n=1 Tax=Chitiniphilus eburneus TaxID=2571148 RepID=UPI00145C85E4|nr:hypothetical protein [Chitiniphilus eburneus]